uniref:CCHC-type domain-containing protein n=1 Tax=Strongyloides venezuelensis TaxID=75913 RepID=A0A0K0FQY3_STRVS
MEVTFKTELLRVSANMKQLREFILMNLHTSTMELIEKLTYFNLTYHVEKDHSLGHKKNNIKCYECGQYGHKKDQCKKGKTEQGESSSYYRRGNEQDEVRSSKNKTVKHIVGLEDVVINNMKHVESDDERSKMLNQFTIEIRIGDYIYKALVDTGAEISILPKQRIKIEKMIPCNKKIKGYADGEIVLCGTCMNAFFQGGLSEKNLDLFDITSRRKMYTNSILEDDFCVATEGNLESHMLTVFDLLRHIQQLGYIYNLANFVTNKKDEINFDEKNLYALKNLNKAISNPKWLRRLNPNKQIYMKTDALQLAIGDFVYQLDGQNILPIQYYSKKLTKCKRSRCATFLELYSIVYGIQKCRAFLSGRKLTIYTDHKPLVGLRIGTNISKYMELLFSIEDQEYKLIYKRGCENHMAYF